MNELIEAAKAVIDRWDSTDWKAAPTAEVMNRLRAALSAKPAKLPKEWITAHSDIADEFDFNTWVIAVGDVRTYLQQLTAAHAAELKEKDAEIDRLKRLLRDAAADFVLWRNYVSEYWVKNAMGKAIEKYREAGEATK